MFVAFRKFFAFLLAVAVLFPSGVASADVPLPAPQRTGGPGLFDAIGSRASALGTDFASMGEVSPEKLSTILWAATGLNRGEKGWTVPMAMGMEPYVKVYVARADGVFLYDWKAHALKEVSGADVRGRIGKQDFVAKAPCTLILVSDSEALSRKFKDDDAREQFAAVAAGAMAQDVYLAAGAVGVGTRYIRSVREDDIEDFLGLQDDDDVLCIMPMGTKPGA